MAKGRNRPALYEVIAERPRGVSYRAPAARPAVYDEPDVGSDEDRVLWLSPGHALRIPVGVVIAACAVAVAVAVGTYVVGFDRGREDAISEFESLQQLGILPPIDPLASEGGDAGAAGVVPPGPRRSIREILNQPPPVGPGSSEAAVPGRTERSGDPVGASDEPRTIIVDRWEDDPRASGLNYFHLAFIREEDAESAARFVAAQGISAARLPANGRGLASVIALRGFEPGTLGGAEAREFERRLKQIGRLYRAEGGGATDFSDLYPERYD